MVAIKEYNSGMAILLHVLIALTSLVYAGYVYFSPSKTKLYAAYGLVALTLISGTYLVVTMNTPLLQACSTGLLYLGVVLSGLLAAHRKLATQVSTNE